MILSVALTAAVLLAVSLTLPALASWGLTRVRQRARSRGAGR